MSVSNESYSFIKEKEIEDPLERMLKKTGCIELHYQVQECFAETQDWRKCQTEIKEFKKCMEVYRKKQEESYKS
ncbi:cytochrome c oxidase assembly factor 4 homolog, mitochondrial [Copidosoma floridanum]|uniref:cytochrome c oxidase assembly factor 4 homolog, mitochondrial n=1 Tax=Copidosoma floridanum TaxID=29053 RepID=UPI0006C96BA2|nr:cytochrome c oxidase assembly factor 4 homolog, mitochondrial [Copidosoma floridanum]XP_014216153.1 cytochrome c oxidase assembly factor 4 homolog, mitochondrial [Copidosoma floridanum]